MIEFVIVSSDFRPYVLDTQVKRGVELPTSHHLVALSHWTLDPRELPRCLGAHGRIHLSCEVRYIEYECSEISVKIICVKSIPFKVGAGLR